MIACYNCTYPLAEPDWADKIKYLIYLDKLTDKFGKLLYPDSNFVYCVDCWENKKEIKCEKCNKDIIAYYCEKDMPYLTNLPCGQMNHRDYKRVCFHCKCDGINCDYC